MEINILASRTAKIACLYAQLNQITKAEQTIETIQEWLNDDAKGTGAIDSWEAIGLIRFQKEQYEESYFAYLKSIQLRDNPQLSIEWNFLASQSALFAGRYEDATEQFKNMMYNYKNDNLEINIKLSYLKFLLEKNPQYLEDSRMQILGHAATFNKQEYRISYIYEYSVHKSVHDFWQQQNLTTITAKLSRPDGIGTRQITWTIDSGISDQAHLEQSGKVALRHHRLKRLWLEAAVQDAIPTQEDFAQALGVTLRTIENDLATLRANGMEIRTLGMQKEVVKK